MVVCLCSQVITSTSTAELPSSSNEDKLGGSNVSIAIFATPSTSSKDYSSNSDSVFPTNDLTPTKDESVMPTESESVTPMPTRTETITPHDLPTTTTSNQSSGSQPPLPSPTTSLATISPTLETNSSSVSRSSVGPPSPTSPPPPMPQSCSCVKSLALSLGLSIPATAMLAFIGTALLFMYCPKAKKNSPYVRMAPTVYFDEEEQD